MPIGPKGPPKKPGLSLRGRVIFDTVRGVPRARPWPPSKPTKPGTPRHATAQAFGAANRACKVTASAFYGAHWEATRGTPLLPRDLMIAMMYGRAFALELTDGRIIRSMASRNDVSKSLDMITQTQGSILIRGEKYWQETQLPTPEDRSATIGIGGTLAGIDARSGYTVPWSLVYHDDGGWTNLATDPNVFTIPAGVSKIQCTIQIRLTGFTVGNFLMIALLQNGVLTSGPRVMLLDNPGATQPVWSVTSRALKMDPGETVGVYISTSDPSIDITTLGTYFSVTAV